MGDVPNFSDELTPLPFAIPRVEDLPLEVALIKRTLTSQAQLLQEMRIDRAETRRGFRNVWLALLGVAMTIFLAAGGALVQMGQYMERIDHIAESQTRIETRFNQRR